MGRTWLVRGVAVAVLAVLLGAWAVGVSGLRESDGASPERDTPTSPERSQAPDVEPAVDDEGDTVKPPRIRKVDRTRDAADEPSRETDEPAGDVPASPSPTEGPPTADPTVKDEDPSDQPPPPPPPTTPPTDPSDECTDLLGVLDCVLDPVTAGP